MQLLLWFFVFAGIANFSGGLVSVISWFFVRKKYGKARQEKNKKASIIIPFKGKNVDNIEYFLKQDYNDYEVIVVVDSMEEANEIKSKFGVKVEITEKLPKCSGKISAMLTGIKKSNGNIYIFADADIKPHEKWLSYLVGGIEKNSIATSYRWYFENKLLSVWNASVASILFYNAFNFAWGGSMAIAKKDFENLGIAKIWRESLVDDLTLTMKAKKSGYKINFIPQAISEAEEEEHMIKWMNKEMAWIRYYFPSLWGLALFITLAMRAGVVAGFVIFFFHPVIGFMLFSPIIFDIFRGWQEYVTFTELMEYDRHRFFPWYVHAFLRPLIPFILAYNLISSAFIREIEWGGKKYKIARNKIDGSA